MFFKVFRFTFYYIRRIFLFIVVFAFVLLYKAKIGGNYSDDDTDVATNISKNIPIERNLETEQISRFIQLSNKEENIINTDAFGAVTEDTIILVILIDKISSRLNLIISSLAHVQGIEEALVIFSHSYLDKEINNVIQSIDFCRVWQIYYPYSIQTHPNEFPGYVSEDCSGESSYFGVNCNGSLYRDIHGRFRNPTGAEKKHHWWWTANNVFEMFSSTLRHTGLVIFSDDSFVFMKDFIYMVSYMRNVAKSLPQCELLSLGSDITPAVPEIIELQDSYSVKLTTWNLKEHSRMLAFDMSVWNSIVSHYDVFCTLDDASWLRSLYYISVTRRDGKGFKALSAVAPRAYKIDACVSAHFFSPPCNLSKNALIITRIEMMNDQKWFPAHLELYINVELDDDDDVIFDYSEGDGGWADPRDWALCRNMTAGKIKKILMEMRNEFHEYFGGKS